MDLRRIARHICLGFLCLNGSALHVALKQPRSLLNYLSELKRVYLMYSCEPLSRVDLSAICPEDLDEMFLPLQYVRPGSTPFNDLVGLAVLAQMKRPECIFEIGTFEGLSACVFAGNSPDDAKVYTLDLPSDYLDRTERSYEACSIRERYQSGHLIDLVGLSTKIVRLYGDSARFDFKPWHDSVDLFFIDGAHTEDYVTNDSKVAFQCIKEDGLVIWHDCFNSDVLRVIKRYAKKVPVKFIWGTSLAFATGKPGQ